MACVLGDKKMTEDNEIEDNKIGKDDKRYIVSVRVCDQEFAVPGSVKRTCMRCGELVWISPVMEDKKMDGVICDHCFKDEDIEEGGKNLIVKKEVIEEVMKYKFGQTRRKYAM